MEFIKEIEDAFLKLRSAYSLEIEAIQQFYEAKVKMLKTQCNVENKEIHSTNIPPKNVKEIKEFPPKVDGFAFPTGIYPQAILNLKPVKKPVICRDCHKQIKGTVHDVGDGFNVCDECFAKRIKNEV